MTLIDWNEHKHIEDLKKKLSAGVKDFVRMQLRIPFYLDTTLHQCIIHIGTTGPMRINSTQA